MPADAHDRPASAAGRAAAEPASVSRASLSAVLIGAALAAALMILLDFLGLGIGLFAVEPGETEGAATNFGIGAIVYLVIASILATVVGGYAAGRLSGALTTETAALHGAGVWAAATFIVVTGVGYVGGAAAQGAYGALASTAQAAREAASAVIPQDVELPDMEIPDVAMEDLPPEVRQAIRERDLTIDDIRREARSVAFEVIDRRERERISDAATAAAAGAIRNPTQIVAELEQAADRIVGAGGALSEEDVAEARDALSRRLGIEPDEAEQLLRNWADRAAAAAEEVEQTAAEAREAAVEAADAAADATATASLIAFFVSAAGLAGAAGGAIGARPDRPVAPAAVREAARRG